MLEVSPQQGVEETHETDMEIDARSRSHRGRHRARRNAGRKRSAILTAGRCDVAVRTTTDTGDLCVLRSDQNQRSF